MKASNLTHYTDTCRGRKSCTQSSGILHSSLSDPLAHVSARLVWEELKTQRKRKCLTHLAQRFIEMVPFTACHVDVDHFRDFSVELQLYLKAQSVRISSV